VIKLYSCQISPTNEAKISAAPSVYCQCKVTAKLSVGTVLQTGATKHVSPFCNLIVQFVVYIILYGCETWGMQWRSWLRYCATSRKVAGSIPDGVTGIFH
jgi:hypothetical protein